MTLSVTRADRAAGRVATLNRPQQVYGGRPTEPCGWPFVVAVDGDCTGVLISAEHVLTAAHCRSDSRHVVFGEDAFNPNRRVAISTCNRLEGGEPGRGNDLMVCTLATPQRVPTVQLLTAAEALEIDPGTWVALVGFGETEDGTRGTKREVWTTLGEENEAGERQIGGEGRDTCNGDSGEPALVFLDGLGWRVVGITSYGFTCGEGGWYTQPHHHEAWLADQTATDRCSLPWDAGQGEWETSCVPPELQGEDPCALEGSAKGCSLQGDSVPGPGAIFSMLLIMSLGRRFGTAAALFSA